MDPPSPVCQALHEAALERLHTTLYRPLWHQRFARVPAGSYVARGWRGKLKHKDSEHATST